MEPTLGEKDSTAKGGPTGTGDDQPNHCDNDDSDNDANGVDSEEDDSSEDDDSREDNDITEDDDASVDDEESAKKLNPANWWLGMVPVDVDDAAAGDVAEHLPNWDLIRQRRNNDAKISVHTNFGARVQYKRLVAPHHPVDKEGGQNLIRLLTGPRICNDDFAWFRYGRQCALWYPCVIRYIPRKQAEQLIRSDTTTYEDLEKMKRGYVIPPELVYVVQIVNLCHVPKEVGYFHYYGIKVVRPNRRRDPWEFTIVKGESTVGCLEQDYYNFKAERIRALHQLESIGKRKGKPIRLQCSVCKKLTQWKCRCCKGCVRVCISPASCMGTHWKERSAYDFLVDKPLESYWKQ